jgi:hypothetical protein
MISVGTLLLTLGHYARSGFGTLTGISGDSMLVHMDFRP